MPALQESSKPNPDLKSLDRLVGIWKISGTVQGSPAYYRGKFSDDGSTLTGGWVWPGGGYESTMTRIK
ncbi:MAG: hypothetical protein AB1489_09340 [Acidobacteriota bacterium]